MTAKILDGKMISKRIKDELKTEVAKLAEKNEHIKLTVIIVGDNSASKIYVKNKRKDCEEVGFISEEIELNEKTTEEELLNIIDRLNNDDETDGILVQLPLPKHICEEKIINAISPKKDVDAFHPVNVGKIMVGNYDFLPCTPAGIMELIKESNVDITGKNCVVIGRSNIVGKPMAMLLLQSNGTVTICHSKTRDLKEITKKADVLVVAIGKANFVTGDMIKQGAVVIDVGMNRNEEGKLCGDVNFNECVEKASAITPVPGGVGPMTRAMLLKNTLKAYEMKNENTK